jgi:predicted nucleic acid-binding protein
VSKRVFIDTNILVYAEQPAEGKKHLRARALRDEHAAATTAVISTQILQEYFNTAVNKLKMPAALAQWHVQALSRLDVVLIDSAIVLGAIDLHRLHYLSIWDALVIKAAHVSNCSVVLTEDMSHGQIIDGVRIENPFLPPGTAAEPRARYLAMPELQYVDGQRSAGAARSSAEPAAKPASSRRSPAQRTSARAR